MLYFIPVCVAGGFSAIQAWLIPLPCEWLIFDSLVM